MTRPQTNACFQSPVQLLKQVLCATLQKATLEKTQRFTAEHMAEEEGGFFWGKTWF